MRGKTIFKDERGEVLRKANLDDCKVYVRMSTYVCVGGEEEAGEGAVGGQIWERGERSAGTGRPVAWG